MDFLGVLVKAPWDWQQGRDRE